MKGFRWAGDLNGQKNPIIRKCYVPDATAIELGEPIQYSVGVGIIVHAGPGDFDDPVYGVAMEEKAANDGKTWIDVSVSPTAIYRWNCRGKTYTATGGSTTTVVDSSLVPATDNIWIGGKVRIVSCAADSSLNGREFSISDSTGGSGTLTLAETLPASIAAGDTYQLCPGYMLHGHVGYDLDSTAMDIDWDADGGETLEIVDTNTDTFDVFVLFRKYKLLS